MIKIVWNKLENLFRKKTALKSSHKYFFSSTLQSIQSKACYALYIKTESLLWKETKRTQFTF